MNRKNISIHCLVVLFTVVLGCAVFTGCNAADYMYRSTSKGSIYVTGGSVITFQAVTKNADGSTTAIVPSAADMTTLEGIFDARMQSEGYTESRISHGDDGKVTVEIPEMTDTDAAASLLGSTAKLTFNDADGNVVLDGGTDIKSASYEYGATDQRGSASHHIKVEFNADAQQKFADATRAAAARTDGNNYISIMIDGRVISSPTVSKEINDTSCVITGNFTPETARLLANQIQAGTLPVDLEIIEKKTITP